MILGGIALIIIGLVGAVVNYKRLAHTNHVAEIERICMNVFNLLILAFVGLIVILYNLFK